MAHDIQELIAQVNSGDAARVAAAAESLSQLGHAARPAAVALAQAVRTENETARAWVVAALEEVGPPSEEQLDALARLLHDSSPDVGYWAVTLLGRAGAAAAGVVDEIVEMLRNSPELATRERAAWALGKIGPPATLAVPALHLAAASDEPRLSRVAKSALAAIAGE